MGATAIIFPVQDNKLIQATMGWLFTGKSMDRQIVYPGAIPLETDLLNTNNFAMTGMARLAMAMLGSETCLYGLHCTPASPPSMSVIVGPGQIYSLQPIDNTPYSSLPADTSQRILKQGVICESLSFTLSAPVTSGYSTNYLIQVAYEEVDSDEIVLPYYNASNPAVAYSGPEGSGKAQPAKRSGVCRLVLKAGTSSATGSQVTPQPDAGFVAAWGITVTSGANAITQADIFMMPAAPFLPSCGIYSSIQRCTSTFAYDTGKANHYSAAFKPVLAELTDGMRLTFKAREANTGSCSFSANGGVAYPLYSHAHQDLQGGEIINGGMVEVQWNSSLKAWLMCRNTGGATPVSDALKSRHALSLNQADGRYQKKGEGYSEEQFKKTFLPLTGGTLTGKLTISDDVHVIKTLNVDKDIKGANLHAGDAFYDENGDVYAAHWKNAEDDEVHKKHGAEKTEKRGWLTKWLKQKFAETAKYAEKQFLPFSGGMIKGDLSVTGEINTAKALKIGSSQQNKMQAEIDNAGNLRGQQWNGNLSDWLTRYEIKRETNSSEHWWFKHPLSGLMIQGGSVNRSDTVTRVSFPVSFTSSSVTVLISLTRTDGKSVSNYTVSSTDYWGFKIVAGRGESAFNWIAIGR